MGEPTATGENVEQGKYPAYVEFTVRMNVESAYEFDSIRGDIAHVCKRWSTVRLHGNEAAVQVAWTRSPGVRPIPESVDSGRSVESDG